MTDDNKFKDAETLRKMFTEAGAEAGDSDVSYCYIGQQCSLLYFAAKLLGYDAKRFHQPSKKKFNRSRLFMAKL